MTELAQRTINQAVEALVSVVTDAAVELLTEYKESSKRQKGVHVLKNNDLTVVVRLKK